MATNKIDMSLDDIIKLTNVRRGGRGGRLRGRGVGRGNRRGTTAGFRGRGFRTRGAGGGVLRGGVQKRGRGFRGFQTRGRASAGWQRGGTGRASFQARFQQRSNMGAGDNAGGGGGGISKLLISNLDFGVNDADIKELFSEFGAMRRAAVHYDRSGRSLGSAEVIYSMRAAGFRAQQQYNNVPLDGRPMKIQLVGGPETVSQSTTATISPRGGFGRGAGRGGGRGRMRGFGRRGRGGRGGASSRPTKDELDAQLDAYNAKMDTL